MQLTKFEWQLGNLYNYFNGKIDDLLYILFYINNSAMMKSDLYYLNIIWYIYKNYSVFTCTIVFIIKYKSDQIISGNYGKFGLFKICDKPLC